MICAWKHYLVHSWYLGIKPVLRGGALTRSTSKTPAASMHNLKRLRQNTSSCDHGDGFQRNDDYSTRDNDVEIADTVAKCTTINTASYQPTVVTCNFNSGMLESMGCTHCIHTASDKNHATIRTWCIHLPSTGGVGRCPVFISILSTDRWDIMMCMM